MENKYKEIKLDISLLEDDLEMIEDKEIIKVYKTEIALKTKELYELKINSLIGVCYNWQIESNILFAKVVIIIAVA